MNRCSTQTVYWCTKMSATTEQYNDNLQPLLVWALNPPENSGQNRKDHPPEPYRSWIEGHFPEDRQYIKYWTGKITPTSKLTEDGEWVDRYPHIHTESVGWDPSTVARLSRSSPKSRFPYR